MTFIQFENVISRITYKPNTFIKAQHRMDQAGYEVTVGHYVPDSRTGLGNDPVLLKSILDYHMIKKMPGEEQVLFFVGQLWRNLELHELDEWFKLDGVCVTNPHPNKK